MIRDCVQRALDAVDKERVRRQQTLTLEQMDEAVREVRGAVMMAWPMGLPPFDPVQMILDDQEELEGTAAGKEHLDPETAALWWASKELLRDSGKKLMDYVGRNDKTKIVVKLQRKGTGPPAREPAVDTETQKQMMAYYYKKQEEHKKLMESAEDDYLNSEWADPKRLKNYFNGVGQGVSWKPR